jgi:transcriptional regulator with XRE-family HTH domain
LRVKVGRTDKNKKVDPAIGPRIREARELLRLTQADLAGMFGGEAKGIQNNELGKTMPNSRVIAALVAAGVNANWILSGIGPKLLAKQPAMAEEIPSGSDYVAVAPNEAPAFVLSLQEELGYDPGSKWTGLLIEMMIDRSMTPAGARKVLQHLGKFQRDAGAAEPPAAAAA